MLGSPLEEAEQAWDVRSSSRRRSPGCSAGTPRLGPQRYPAKAAPEKAVLTKALPTSTGASMIGETKSSPYVASVRPEIHDLISPGCRKFLDVGCNDGTFGEWLKQTRSTDLVAGIEPHPQQAALARKRLDLVVEGAFPDVLTQLSGRFDCITFNHVLEHVFDPWAALRQSLHILAPGGQVVALIPNVRYLSLVFDLVIRGRWTYTETGLLDRTHIRFFTRRSALDMFQQSGYRVVRIKRANAFGSVRAPLLSRLLAATLGELAHGAFAFVAVPATDGQLGPGPVSNRPAIDKRDR